MAPRYRWGACALSALLLGPATATAESAVFMCIADIPGSSLDDEFQRCSSIFGVGHSVEVPLDRGGAQPARPTCNPYEVSKPIDEASGPILNRTLRGRGIDEVEFAIRKTGEDQLVVFELLLKDVALVGVAQDFSAAADFPTELITMLPRSVQWRFTPQDPDGSPGVPRQFSLTCP